MASAMIDRAEFPVQRKSTFKGSWSLATFITPSLAALRQGSWLLTTFITPSLAALRQRRRNEWLANFALAATTVFHEKREQVSRPFKVNRIDDRPAFFA
jgi:hypothetical protein